MGLVSLAFSEVGSAILFFSFSFTTSWAFKLHSLSFIHHVLMELIIMIKFPFEFHTASLKKTDLRLSVIPSFPDHRLAIVCWVGHLSYILTIQMSEDLFCPCQYSLYLWYGKNKIMPSILMVLVLMVKHLMFYKTYWHRYLYISKLKQGNPSNQH